MAPGRVGIKAKDRPNKSQSYGLIAASNASGSKSNASSKLESGSEPPGLFVSVFCHRCCDWLFVGTCTRGGRNGRFTAAECSTFEDGVDADADKDAERVIPSARRDPCEDDNNSWDAVIAVVDALRRGSDSGVIGMADPPASFFAAAPATASVAEGRVGVGTGCCGKVETRGAKGGGASGVGLVDVAGAATGFGQSVGCGWGRRSVGTGRAGVGEGGSAGTWEFSVCVERSGTCCFTLPARVEQEWPALSTVSTHTSGSTSIMGASSASVSVRAAAPAACNGENFGGMMGRLE